MKRLALTLATGMGLASFAHAAIATELYVSRDQIRQAQQALRQEGYGVATTGTINLQTETALRQYQRANNLVPTGMLDNPTLVSLNVENAGAAAREQSEIRRQASPGNGPLDNNMGTGQANTNASGY